MKVRCVIYDCDGVLFDSLEANERLYNDLCAAVGRIPLREEERAYAQSHTVFEAIHFLFGQDGLEKTALEELKKIDFRDYLPYLKMEPHLIEALDGLRLRGILRAICTNRTTSMKYIMERFSLEGYFDQVVTALDVKHPKPHPESVEKILASLSLHREEAVFVGDSEVDRMTAQAAGVTFIAYKSREIKEGLAIMDHLDLVKVISKEGFSRRDNPSRSRIRG